MSDVESYEELDTMLTGISIRIDIAKSRVGCIPTFIKIVFIRTGHFTCGL